MDRAGSGSSTAYPAATINHGFHRQCQAFQLANGPPWIHSNSGAGSTGSSWADWGCAEWGRTSQDRTG